MRKEPPGKPKPESPKEAARTAKQVPAKGKAAGRKAEKGFRAAEYRPL
jgi:hypothetical protein